VPKRNAIASREMLVSRLLLESFSEKQSLYHDPDKSWSPSVVLERFGDKLRWHIGHSLSPRQKEVIKHYLNGKTEREIAAMLGISQQVVHIYKHRAIRKLRKVMVS
jgi:DNA-binding CsgD family transcriptional regulator